MHAATTRRYAVMIVGYPVGGQDLTRAQAVCRASAAGAGFGRADPSRRDRSAPVRQRRCQACPACAAGILVP